MLYLLSEQRLERQRSDWCPHQKRTNNRLWQCLTKVFVVWFRCRHCRAARRSIWSNERQRRGRGRFVQRVPQTVSSMLCLLCDHQLVGHSPAAVIALMAHADARSEVVMNGLCDACAVGDKLIERLLRRATKMRSVTCEHCRRWAGQGGRERWKGNPKRASRPR